MDPERRILVDGAVAIGNGRILDVGPDRDVSPVAQAAATRDLGGALVHPGLVDAHVHAGSSELSRGLAPKDHADYGAVDDWLFTHPQPGDRPPGRVALLHGDGHQRHHRL